MKQPAGSSGHFIPQPASHRVVIPPVPQALLSSYASRLRTGTTLLVQPISTPGQAPVPGTAAPTGSYTPVAAATAASRATRGRASAVNYTEAGSGDEFEEPPEKAVPPGGVDSDDSDFQASGGTRTMVRRMGRGPGSSAVLNAKLTNAVAANKEHGELDKSHLGSVPPLHFLRPLMVHNFKVEHQSVYFLRSVCYAHASESPIERLEAQANLPTVLIPIRIEIDTDTLRIRDCFTWNLNGA